MCIIVQCTFRNVHRQPHIFFIYRITGLLLCGPIYVLCRYVSSVETLQAIIIINFHRLYFLFFTDLKHDFKTFKNKNICVCKSSINFSFTSSLFKHARFICIVCICIGSSDGLTSIPQQIYWLQLKQLLLRLCTTCHYRI